MGRATAVAMPRLQVWMFISKEQLRSLNDWHSDWHSNWYSVSRQLNHDQNQSQWQDHHQWHEEVHTWSSSAEISVHVQSHAQFWGKRALRRLKYRFNARKVTNRFHKY